MGHDSREARGAAWLRGAGNVAACGGLVAEFVVRPAGIDREGTTSIARRCDGPGSGAASRAAFGAYGLAAMNIKVGETHGE